MRQITEEHGKLQKDQDQGLRAILTPQQYEKYEQSQREGQWRQGSGIPRREAPAQK